MIILISFYFLPFLLATVTKYVNVGLEGSNDTQVPNGELPSLAESDSDDDVKEQLPRLSQIESLKPVFFDDNNKKMRHRLKDNNGKLPPLPLLNYSFSIQIAFYFRFKTFFLESKYFEFKF